MVAIMIRSHVMVLLKRFTSTTWEFLPGYIHVDSLFRVFKIKGSRLRAHNNNYSADGRVITYLSRDSLHAFPIQVYRCTHMSNLRAHTELGDCARAILTFSQAETPLTWRVTLYLLLMV